MALRALTADVLDRMGCETPNCDHDHSEIYLHQHCHPDAAIFARYVKADHTLIFECADCEREVTTILVATAQ